MDIRVAIVEDHKEFRELLAGIITRHPGYTCVSSAANTIEAVQRFPAAYPDVVLVDIHLPGPSGIVCITQLKPLLPKAQFVVCSSLEDSNNIFDALKAGATGYLSKATTAAKILEAITDAHHGGSPMSGHIARKVVHFFQENEPENKPDAMAPLSAREHEILHYLSKGYRYKEIAGMLFISIETVRKHIYNIYRKLQVNSKMDAVNKMWNKK